MGENKLIYDVRNISFQYPNANEKVLDDCSFQLRKGEIVCVLGANGAGKTTLLNCLCHLLDPQSGEIFLENENIKNLSHKKIAQKVAYVQQKIALAFPYLVLDYVSMGAAARIGFFQKPGKEIKNKSMEILKRLRIEHLANKAITELSGGEQQQVIIARAILQDPELIIFDEPTAHLDYGKQLLVIEIIQQMLQEGYSIIMTTHNPDHVLSLAGKLAILDERGKMTLGDASELLSEERLYQIYKRRLRLIYIEELGRSVCVSV